MKLTHAQIEDANHFLEAVTGKRLSDAEMEQISKHLQHGFSQRDRPAASPATEAEPPCDETTGQPIDDYTRRLQQAFFAWKAMGYKSAWEAMLLEARRGMVPAPTERTWTQAEKDAAKVARDAETMEEIAVILCDKFSNVEWNSSVRSLSDRERIWRIIDAILPIARRGMVPATGRGFTAEDKMVWEAITRFCNVEQVNKISGYVLERRDKMGSSDVGSVHSSRP